MRLLIIERSEDVCKALKMTIEDSLPEFTVDCVTSLDKALEYLKKRQAYDLIILDHYTFRLANDKKAKLGANEILVISSLNNDNTNCLDQLKVDQVLKKPLDAKELIEYLKRKRHV